MKAEDFRKKILDMADSTDIHDLKYNVKISHDSKMFTVRLPKSFAENLKIETGEFLHLELKYDDIKDRKGTFKIVKKDD